MASHRGITVAVALMFGLPIITLIATAYQMVGTGGDGLILPAKVAQPPAVAAPQASGAAAPAGQAAPSGAAQAPALPAVVAAGKAPAVPGRSALDFSTPGPAWQAGLAKGDIDAGKQLARDGKQVTRDGKQQTPVQACVTCHGAAGITPLGGAFPNLAGLSQEYLAKQLWDFREGTRPHPLMSGIAKALDEQEVADLARYYGSLPHAAPDADRGPAANFPQAARLDVTGDGPRALPACANCHGLQGHGEGVLLPRLAGQPGVYFVDQMNGFRSGQRQNDDVGVMRAFAQRLTPEEIVALARYYESMGTTQQNAGAGNPGAAPGAAGAAPPAAVPAAARP